jgi:hypothetical protein
VQELSVLGTRIKFGVLDDHACGAGGRWAILPAFIERFGGRHHFLAHGTPPPNEQLMIFGEAGLRDSQGSPPAFTGK